MAEGLGLFCDLGFRFRGVGFLGLRVWEKGLHVQGLSYIGHRV